MTKYGLSTQQAQESLKKHGSNALSEVRGESFWHKLGQNFRDPMIKILCVALVINIVLAIVGQAEWYESVGIAAAVVIATLVSTYSEYRNEGAFQKLQEEASRITCKVYRDGELRELSIDEIVVGDDVLLQTGDKVPADGYVFDGFLSVNQAALNGETADAEKEAAEQGYQQSDETDFLSAYDLYRGSIVVNGNAVLHVTKVGDATVYGTIAAELQQDDNRETPLKVKLAGLARTISRFGYIGGVAIAIAYIFQALVIHNGFDPSAIFAYCSNPLAVIHDLVEAIMLAVIIIVMAVPEGLPLMIALVSSMNMGKMLKDNVLVREINGIETAGSLNILFSDKTGTITKGQLEVVSFIDSQGGRYQTLEAVPSAVRDAFVENVFMNSDAVLVHRDDGIHAIGGNATERALLSYAASEQGGDASKVAEIPFDSAQKYSAAEVISDGCSRVLIKGAPELLIANCDKGIGKDGSVASIDPASLEAAVDSLAEKAMRVLAFACYDGSFENGALDFSAGWTFVGMVGIRDEVRPESVDAIRETKAAGIQVVMITGDRRETAEAIAKDVGLIESPEDLVLTSSDLRALSDEEVAERLPQIRVIARALPGDKSRLVKVAQSLNLVVGMTGDGVNDSAALKRADVGFAMGGGTEVAKEASEIVILDDNFSSIEKAVLYGRTIFNSIRKFVIFQLTINVSAVLVSFVFPLLGMDTPLSITQILWVNLVMDTLAALAFGGEPALARFMQEKPKRRDEPIVSSYMWSAILCGSVLTFFLSLIILSPLTQGVFRSAPHNEYLLTGYFCFFIFAAVFNAFNARTEKLNLFDSIGRNKGFLGIILLIVVVQVLLAYFGGPVFRCYGLTLQEWALVVGLAFLIIPVDLIRKVNYRARMYRRGVLASDPDRDMNHLF